MSPTTRSAHKPGPRRIGAGRRAWKRHARPVGAYRPVVELVLELRPLLVEPPAPELPVMLDRLGWSVTLPEPDSDPLVVPVAEQPTRIPNIDARAVPITSFLCMSASTAWWGVATAHCRHAAIPG